MSANRMAIGGWPRSGKTTLASGLGGHWLHTDDAIGADWSASSEAVSHWFDGTGDLLVEGVMVPRALRKWLERNPGKPIHTLLYLRESFGQLSPGQKSMGKGCDTVLREIREELTRRDVAIVMMVKEQLSSLGGVA